jgi:hypothetical protein
MALVGIVERDRSEGAAVRAACTQRAHARRFSDREARGHTHSDGLVELLRSGRAFRVHPETGSGHAPITKLREGVKKERATDPASTKKLAHAEDSHPAEPRVDSVRMTDRETGGLVSRDRKSPQHRHEHIGCEELVLPLLVRLVYGLPRVLERLLVKVVEDPFVAVLEIARIDSGRPDVLWSPPAEIDRHAVRVADPAEPASLEIAEELLLCLPAAGDETRAHLPRPLLRPVEELRGRLPGKADPDAFVAEALDERVRVRA